MTGLVDRMLETFLSYDSPLSHEGVCVFVSERELSRRAKGRPRRSVSLVGKKAGRETGYFHLNAWMLGECALELEAEHRDHAIAILFRDSDGTRSTPGNTWAVKHASMVDGFDRAAFPRGVPMLPRPKSEAWLLALCTTRGEDATVFERWSGNDASANSLKSRLATARREQVSAQELLHWLTQARVDLAGLLDLQSFSAFHGSLMDSVASLRDAAKVAPIGKAVASTSSDEP